MELTESFKSGQDNAVGYLLPNQLMKKWSSWQRLAGVAAACLWLAAGALISTAQTAADSGGFPPAITQLLPAGAVMVQVLDVDFEGSGTRSLVISYAMAGAKGAAGAKITSDPDANATRLRVLRPKGRGEWAIAFDDAFDTEATGDTTIGKKTLKLELIRSAIGKEGVVERTHDAGVDGRADGVASWIVLAEEGGQFVHLDPTLIVDRVFREKGYTEGGSGSTKIERDAVVETQSGYRVNAEACCSSLPPFVISVKFTGTSLKLNSVRWLLLARTNPMKNLR
jgi:hypothetical protein